jgi:hypothetical protein
MYAAVDNDAPVYCYVQLEILREKGRERQRELEIRAATAAQLHRPPHVPHDSEEGTSVKVSWDSSLTPIHHKHELEEIFCRFGAIEFVIFKQRGSGIVHFLTLASALNSVRDPPANFQVGLVDETQNAAVAPAHREPSSSIGSASPAEALGAQRPRRPFSTFAEKEAAILSRLEAIAGQQPEAHWQPGESRAA